MVADVVDSLVLEILKTRGLKKKERISLLFTLSNAIAFQPYKFNKITNKFESSGGSKAAKIHSISVFTVAILTFTCGLIKTEELENVLIRIFITSSLFYLSYVMQFTQTTAANFSMFINRVLEFKKRLTPPKRRNINNHSRDARVVFVKMACSSVEYFAALISVICAIAPDSPFNPLEIVTLLFKQFFHNESFLLKLILPIQTVVCWVLWSSIIPVVQLSTSATLIFTFNSLKLCTSLLFE